MRSENVIKNKLSNGIRVLVDYDKGFRTSAVVVALLGGSRDEARETLGLTHLLEHLLFKRTSSRNTLEIAQDIASVGGRINASTDVDALCLYGIVPGGSAIPTLQFFAELLLTASFDDTDTELEKEVIRQEILEADDDHFSASFKRFNELFWPNSTLGLPVFGYPTTVAGFGRAAVVERLRTLLVGERIIVSASGNIDVDELCGEVERLFGALPRGELPREEPVHSGFGIDLLPQPISQCHLILGQPWLPMRHADYIAGCVVASILGEGMSSRLFQILREEHGLAYDVAADVEAYADTAALVVTATVERRNLDATQKLLLAQLQRLKQEFVSGDEVARCVQMMSAQLEMQCDDLFARAWRALETEMTFGRYVSVDELLRQLRALCADDLARVVREHFLETPTLLVVGGDVTPGSVRQEMITLCGAMGSAIGGV